MSARDRVLAALAELGPDTTATALSGRTRISRPGVQAALNDLLSRGLASRKVNVHPYLWSVTS